MTDDPRAGRGADDPGPFGPSGPPPDAAMMTLEDAVAAAAEMRRAIARRPAQRALPRGHRPVLHE